MLFHSGKANDLESVSESEVILPYWVCLTSFSRFYVINLEQLFMLLQKCGVEVIFSDNEISRSSSQLEVCSSDVYNIWIIFCMQTHSIK